MEEEKKKGGELALQVHAELEARADEAEALRGQRVQRARQEASLARRRFMEADPGNRLVVDVLEAEWNEKLRALNAAQEEMQERRAQDHPELSDTQRKNILALATDFPRLWSDPKTPQRERKRMARLLLEDVTLTRGEEISLGVRFRGGTCRRLSVLVQKLSWQVRQTPSQIVAEIDELLDHHCEEEIAGILNQRGRLSGEGKPFHRLTVQRIRRSYGLKKRHDRLRDAGLLTATEVAKNLNVTPHTVKIWRANGLLRAHAYNDKNECLYEHPGDHPPTKRLGRKLSARRRFPEVASNRTHEVHCEA
jgi:hypothetical protein